MNTNTTIFQYLHLDSVYSLLNARNVKLLLIIFKSLDIHQQNGLNDIQFYAFMKHMTKLNKNEIYTLFDKLDRDRSGKIEFEEFYQLVCILIAVKDHKEKEFIYRHSRTVFDLLDEDDSDTVSAEEFNNFGFLFNFNNTAVRTVFNEFDLSGDRELDYKEFKMFTMACIDRQREINKKKEKQCKKKQKLNELKEKENKIKYVNNKLGYDYFKSTNNDKLILSDENC